ncbi:MAG TPA: F0F1 ATP synthase subunit delta [Verrucomicrobiae bacterium]|nr:F0F1 ATP synthase subunit delta [Verrucomicrobiae bacterium]
MEFSWSTFLIEIANFAVLVWILTRFLYRPVQRVIAGRQKKIRDELAHAQELAAKSESLVKQYDGRLHDWEAEKAKLKAAFDAELSERRAEREVELRAALAREREGAEAAARLREQETLRKLGAQAAGEAARFCARLLARVASPALEASLVDASIEDLRGLAQDRRALLARSFDGRTEAVVTTRYALDDERRHALLAALQLSLGRAPAASFRQSDDLVAGLRVDLGTMTLEGSLAGELQWFAQAEGA